MVRRGHLRPENGDFPFAHLKRNRKPRGDLGGCMIIGRLEQRTLHEGEEADDVERLRQVEPFVLASTFTPADKDGDREFPEWKAHKASVHGAEENLRLSVQRRRIKLFFL